MWKKRLGLVMVVCMLFQPLEVIAKKSNYVYNSTYGQTAYEQAINGINYSYKLDICETEATVTTCVIGEWGTQKVETVIELQKLVADKWEYYAEWEEAKQGMRMFMEETCKVESGTYRIVVTFRLETEEIETISGVSNEMATGMDFNMDRELSQRTEILERFMSIRTRDKIFENPQEIAEPYIPGGSWCTDVCILGDVLYIDYRLGDIRYIIGYHSDGTVEKTVRAMGGDKIYTVWSDNKGVEVMDL